MPNSLSLNLVVLATKMWVWEQQKHGLLDEQAVQHQRIRACSGQSFCAHLSATSKQCSSPKHLCSSRELQGSPLHTFPSASTLPQRCWQPLTLFQGCQLCQHSHGNDVIHHHGVLMQVLSWAAPLQTPGHPKRVRSSVPNLSKYLFTLESQNS